MNLIELMIAREDAHIEHQRLRDQPRGDNRYRYRAELLVALLDHAIEDAKRGGSIPVPVVEEFMADTHHHMDQMRDLVEALRVAVQKAYLEGWGHGGIAMGAQELDLDAAKKDWETISQARLVVFGPSTQQRGH